MSAEVRFTDAARWQLRAALAAVDRRDAAAARDLLDGVSRLVRDGDLLEKSGGALAEFPAVLCREARLGGYRVFFRREGETVWIAGVWKTNAS